MAYFKVIFFLTFLGGEHLYLASLEMGLKNMHRRLHASKGHNKRDINVKKNVNEKWEFSYYEHRSSYLAFTWKFKYKIY